MMIFSSFVTNCCFDNKVGFSILRTTTGRIIKFPYLENKHVCFILKRMNDCAVGTSSKRLSLLCFVMLIVSFFYPVYPTLSYNYYICNILLC